MAGFHIYQSNDLSRVADQFGSLLGRRSDTKMPFDKEYVVVQTAGMQRWLSMYTALRNTVFAGFEFLAPNDFFNRVYYLLIGTQDGNEKEMFFRKEVLKWALYSLCVENLHEEPLLAPLKEYAGQNRLHLFQACARIADLFDQYMIYRPDMIRAWTQDKMRDIHDTDERWQKYLWQLLARRYAHAGPDRVALKDRLMAHIESHGRQLKGGPLDRIHLFGLSTLPYYHLDVFKALSVHVDVYLFLMNPCKEDWTQVLGEERRYKERMKALAGGIDPSQLYLDMGNMLLSRLGSTGRDFIRMLIEETDLSYESKGVWNEPDTGTLLGAIQDDILCLRDRSADDTQKGDFDIRDRSIQISSCHSPMREVEVLHDHILDMYQRYPDLCPHDILVVTPDIDKYAPFIDVVFSRTARNKKEGVPYIPYTIADRSITAQNRIADVLRQILSCVYERMDASTVLSIFETDAVKEAYGLGEDATETVRKWTVDTGIRWGIDAQHRRSLGFAPRDEYTWLYGLRRLCTGYAMEGNGTQFWESILPYPAVSQSERTVLGSFLHFTSTLFEYSKSVKHSHTIDEWVEITQRLLSELFDTSSGNEDMPGVAADIIRMLSGLSRHVRKADLSDPVPFSVFSHALNSRLGDREESHGFLTNGITFSSMVPMRSIPFRILCMIGMNDATFPRPAVEIDFDLMQREYRIGDRNTRYNDLYLFLELLVSAQDAIYISFTGRNQQNNAPQLMAEPVNSLLEYCDKGFCPTSSQQAPPDSFPDSVRECLLTEYPLQPFDIRYADPNEPRLFTYKEEYFCENGSGVPDERLAPAGVSHELCETPHGILSMSKFLNAFLVPARFFCQEVLGIELPVKRRNELEDAEPFISDNLEKYLAADCMLRHMLRGVGLDTIRRILDARGMMPYGARGDVEWEDAVQKVTPMYEHIERVKTHTLATPVNKIITVEELSLRVCINAIYENPETPCYIRWHPASLKSKGIVDTWLRHVLLNTLYPGLHTHYIGTDKSLRFEPFTDTEEARLYCVQIVRIFHTACTRIIPFLPDASCTYAEKVLCHEYSDEKIINELYRSFYIGNNKVPPGYTRDEYKEFVYRDVNLFGEKAVSEFREIARVICLPMYEHSKEEKIGQ